MGASGKKTLSGSANASSPHVVGCVVLDADVKPNVKRIERTCLEMGILSRNEDVSEGTCPNMAHSDLYRPWRAQADRTVETNVSFVIVQRSMMFRLGYEHSFVASCS